MFKESSAVKCVMTKKHTTIQLNNLASVSS